MLLAAAAAAALCAAGVSSGSVSLSISLWQAWRGRGVLATTGRKTTAWRRKIYHVIESVNQYGLDNVGFAQRMAWRHVSNGAAAVCHRRHSNMVRLAYLFLRWRISALRTCLRARARAAWREHAVLWRWRKARTATNSGGENTSTTLTAMPAYPSAIPCHRTY